MVTVEGDFPMLMTNKSKKDDMNTSTLLAFNEKLYKIFNFLNKIWSNLFNIY